MGESLRLVLVTGLSGAGKTRAMRFLEDLGYFCVDNLPASLLPKFVELVSTASPSHERAAVCVDARSGEELRRLPAYLDEAAERGGTAEILFLDCDDVVVIERYSESRRRHPAAEGTSVEDGIRREREWLDTIRGRADYVLDTTSMSLPELRERVGEIFSSDRTGAQLSVTVLSFGFKFGVPHEADLVFDVRFLPNPFYEDDLRDHTGLEVDVRQYILDNADAVEFLERIRSLLKFLLPRYTAEPKSYLTIAVGCTGGQHRSVALAQEIGIMLRDLNVQVRVRHRELGRIQRS